MITGAVCGLTPRQIEERLRRLFDEHAQPVRGVRALRAANSRNGVDLPYTMS